MIAVSSLSIAGVLAFIVITTAILLCYLKRPEKTPAVLVSTLNYRKLEGNTVMLPCTINNVEQRKTKRTEKENQYLSSTGKAEGDLDIILGCN